MSIGVRVAFYLCCASVAAGESSLLLDTMSGELNRNFSALKQKADPAPYYLAYEVVDQDSYLVSATLGALTENEHSRGRYLDVTLRVGSRKLDNYHRVRGERAQFTAGAPLPLEDVPNAIRRRIWLETDRAYRAAAERLIKIRTNTQVKVAAEDDSDDFSSEEPSSHGGRPVTIAFPADEWATRLRKLSNRFHQYPGILTSSITVLAQSDNRWFASSESSRIQHGRAFARLIVAAQSKAADGMDVAAHESFESAEPGGLPEDEKIVAAIDRVAGDLTGLLKAPSAEPFAGPAIFSGRAAGVFFHEIFGHRIEGHRQKDESEGQTFTNSVGTKVLPDFLSVTFDPTRRKLSGIDLNGWYEYDDEGIVARPVRAVDNGVLKTFLMSRSPVRGFDHSNGHGRRQPGLEVVSRQSNLIVESARSMPEKKLRALLIEEIKRQNKAYGLYFREVTGGFTNTGRAGLQAFKVLPLVVYRIYPDGRPDELIRGADIVGTPLTSFSKILATSDSMEVFNGYCGAESGSVPVSAVSPALLVSEIEIERKFKGQDRPPLLPPPSGAGNAR